MKSNNPAKLRESKTLNCRQCSEKVHNVDSQAVSVLCWKCSTGMTTKLKHNGPKDGTTTDTVQKRS